MADVLIVQPSGQARSLLKRVLEQDGYQVACALDMAAAVAPLYLNSYPLVVIVDCVSARADSCALDLVAVDVGPLGRHRYIVLAEPARDESLWSAESPLALLSCAVVHRPVTPGQIRDLVARYAPQLPGVTLDPTQLGAVAQ